MPKVDIWMPIYIGDYLGDTIELSAAEHGAYLLLLMHYWLKKGEIGDDIERLARVCKVDEKTCSFILGYYFTHEECNYRNKRADIEMANAESRRLASSENGKKGGRPLKNNLEETGGFSVGNLGHNLDESKTEPSPNLQKSSSSSSSSSSSKEKDLKKEEKTFSLSDNSVPDFPDDIESAFNEIPEPSYKKSTLDARLSTLSESWKKHAELPKYVCKLSACMKADLVASIDAVLQAYTDAEIITAIDNYAQDLPNVEAKFRIQSFQNFVANSGKIATYQTIANPEKPKPKKWHVICCNTEIPQSRPFCLKCGKEFNVDGTPK